MIGLLVVGAASPASAANKEHQQLMADIRMLQEQTQLLQNLLGPFNEALKAVNTRLDQQTESNRKAFADQKLVIDNLTNDARVIREKLDDNNVRVGSLTQEVDSLRQSMQQMATRPAATDRRRRPDAAAGGAAPPPPGGAPPRRPACGRRATMTASPQQVWDAAYADYTSGQYDLAVLGFEAYIRNFPKSDSADDAQVLICTAYPGGQEVSEGRRRVRHRDSHLPDRRTRFPTPTSARGWRCRHARRRTARARRGKPSSGVSRTATPAGSPSSGSIRFAGTTDAVGADPCVGRADTRVRPYNRLHSSRE